ncbi:MAG: hypothetical protein CMJ19_20390 [Phycisphaeraceae bacterium]|nr:hypothetical protein [Phycisphaeraceae bacterium]
MFANCKRHSYHVFSRNVYRTIKGFTLVELLIVLGFIFLIISLALPAINNSQQESTRTLCLLKMRQVNQIAINYTEDNNRNINMNMGGLASRLEQVGPLQKDHVDVGPIFDTYVKGWDVPGGKLSRKARIFYCPADKDKVMETLVYHAETPYKTPVLVSYYKAGHNMVTGKNAALINVWPFGYTSQDGGKVAWMERTINHRTGANAVHIDGHGSFVKTEYDVALDPVNALLAAREPVKEKDDD